MNKSVIKFCLLIFNAVLLTAFLLLLCVWVFFVRDNQIAQYLNIGHYKIYSMNDLPQGNKEIGYSYINNLVELDVQDHKKKHDTVGNDNFVQSNNKSNNESDKLLKNIDLLIAEAKNYTNSQNVTENSDIKTKNQQQEDIGNVTSDKNIKGFYGVRADENNHNNQKFNIPNNSSVKISVIVANLGLNKLLTQHALSLPKECALGFYTHTSSANEMMKSAKKSGYKIYSYIPLEKNSNVSRRFESLILTSKLSESDNRKRLSHVLHNIYLYDGLYSDYDEIFTKNITYSNMLTDIINNKNLSIIISKNNGVHLAKYQNAILYDFTLMDSNDISDTTKQLNDFVGLINEKLQRYSDIGQNNFILYVNATYNNIDLLKEWILTQKAHGIAFEPLKN